MKFIWHLAVLLFAFSAAAFDHSHKEWTDVLKNHVTLTGAASTVNYAALKKDPQKLDNYLKTLSAVKNNEFKKWTPLEQQAFLINAYNAFTLKIIIKHYPVKSIKDIGSFFKSTWKQKFFTLLEEKRHLDYIEHGVLRKNYKEPRVHFAVNCASIGCPALLNEAFTANELNNQLEKQTRLFLNDASRNSINEKTKTLTVSKIFKWFSEDFEKNGMTVSRFVAPYITNNVRIQQELKKGLYSISYSDYNWGLNRTK